MPQQAAADLFESNPGDPGDRLLWNYLAKLGLAFAVVVAGAATFVLVYAFAAIWYLASA
jgi:hypothetical protein